MGKKISSAEELQTELRGLIAQAESPNPSRDKLAADIRTLANRVGARIETDGTVAGDLAERLSQDWSYVRYDPKRQTGEARMGQYSVQFKEHGSESSVYLTLIPRSAVKLESLDHAMDFLDAIEKAFHKV